MITAVLCGRGSDPPADPARACALAALVAGELAHRVFLDAADVRIVAFIRDLHQQAGADPHLLDAVLRGLLGAPLPAVSDPLTPLLLLGRGLVLALDLDEQAVAEVVARSEQQLPTRLPGSAVTSNPQPSTTSLPASAPASQPPIAAVLAAHRTFAPPTPPAPRRAKTPFLAGGIIAALGVLALVAMVILPLGNSRNGQNPAPTIPSAPPESDPQQVAHGFAEAVNNEQFDRARELLCSEPSSMTRHMAEGRLRVEEFTVDKVETQNSTTAYLRAKGVIASQSEALVWRGTLRRQGDWCVIDIRPEDNSPPAQPETRDVAIDKMRNFITLLNHGDTYKAMTYVCGTPRRAAIESTIDRLVVSRAQLAVTPDPGPEGARTYTGSVTGQAQLSAIMDVVGGVTISRSADGTYCISRFEVRYEG
ncbi:hypothetical protein ABN034_29210 [Actinopolymorpha sp. B11F2]|uniref:hypothetical protein n=1 Tax=Actinopolymorpha sp. B11F2 TaxID=3160862 RepID=UPI0032E458BF